jgi:2-methylcitrate dehydratase
LRDTAESGHCLQYVTALGPILGGLTADQYAYACTSDASFDAWREKVVVREDPGCTEAYYDAGERAVPNAMCGFFRDVAGTEEVEAEYPVGHRRRGWAVGEDAGGPVCGDAVHLSPRGWARRRGR